MKKKKSHQNWKKNKKNKLLTQGYVSPVANCRRVLKSLFESLNQV